MALDEETMGNVANSDGLASINIQHNVDYGKGKKSHVEVYTPPTKKQKLALNLKSRLPLHLSNLKKKYSGDQPYGTQAAGVPTA